MLRNKKIILGVCGSIAAYKAAILTRLLVKSGAEVKVIITPAAKDFITPLTLATLSKNPALSEFTKNEAGEWNNHVALGLWADAIIIAPASANTLAKMANGICDNLLLATYLSARCPVFVAPAMDLDMYQHPATTANLTSLKTYGNEIIEAEFGELASGLTGNGRMAEPENIIDLLSNFFSTNLKFRNRKVLITAGPTYEKIDPVRFIGNHSSGKMGYAIAHSLADKGADVILVSGPTHLKADHPSISVVSVNSAEEMYQACMNHYPSTDIAILAAAVADYTPKETFEQKLKKNSNDMSIALVKTHDIAASLGEIKKEHQLNIGFALETENEASNALKKLTAKNFDIIVLNSLQDTGAGFGYDTNKISIIDQNKSVEYELKSKKEVAEDIIEAISLKLK